MDLCACKVVSSHNLSILRFKLLSNSNSFQRTAHKITCAQDEKPRKLTNLIGAL